MQRIIDIILRIEKEFMRIYINNIIIFLKFFKEYIYYFNKIFLKF